MENKVSIGSQNTQQVKNSFIDQPKPILKKIMVSFRKISSLILVFGVIFLGLYIFKLKSKLIQNSLVSGNIKYPGEVLPPITVYLKNVQTGKYLSTRVNEGSITYLFSNVSPGNYIVFAYTNDFNPGGQEDLTGIYPVDYKANGCQNLVKPAVIVVNGSTSSENIDICYVSSPEETPQRPK